MFEPLIYYKQLKEFIRGECNWKCKAGRHFFSVDTDGRFLLCSDSVPLNMNILSMDKDYWKKFKNKFYSQLQHCNKTCPENYAYCSSYYNDHKLEFFRRKF